VKEKRVLQRTRKEKEKRKRGESERANSLRLGLAWGLSMPTNNKCHIGCHIVVVRLGHSACWALPSPSGHCLPVSLVVSSATFGWPSGWVGHCSVRHCFSSRPACPSFACLAVHAGCRSPIWRLGCCCRLFNTSVIGHLPAHCLGHCPMTNPEMRARAP